MSSSISSPSTVGNVGNVIFAILSATTDCPLTVTSSTLRSTVPPPPPVPILSIKYWIRVFYMVSDKHKIVFDVFSCTTVLIKPFLGYLFYAFE